MRYRILDQNGDYSFGQGSKDFYINNPAAVAQACLTNLLLFSGEWYLNNNLGVPYFEGILGVHGQAQADATFMAAITAVQGVVSLVNYESTLDPVTRAYSVASGTINTIYGETELDVENLGDF
jgi:hypothetical protein